MGAFSFIADEREGGMRLDAVAGCRIPEISRSFAAELIRTGKITVNGIERKPGYRLRPGDEIHGAIPTPEPTSDLPEPIPIDILYEDLHIVVVNKPPGMVVHPAPGHGGGTLVNALLYHCPGITGVGGEKRPGIVHRLDKDTSGVLVAAKTDAAHRELSVLFKFRKVQKEYLALVSGDPDKDAGTISLPIGRHPVDRKKMSVVGPRSRNAETSWRVIERYGRYALLALDLKTGRTHQIRVHCAAMGHPVIGDPVYGGKTIKISMPLASRQMLHARRIAFVHPVNGNPVSFEAPLPPDMAALVEAFRKQKKDERPTSNVQRSTSNEG